MSAITTAKRPNDDIPRNGLPIRYVRVQMPGGYARIITETDYQRLCANLTELARCLECHTEFLDEAKREAETVISGRFWWHRLFLEHNRE